MRAILFSFLVITLFICNGCYKKFNTDEELHSSMLDEAYSDFYGDPWFYFDSSYYVDNSDSEAQSYLVLTFKIPREHLERVNSQSKIKITHLNTGYSAVRTLYKVDNEATFTLKFLEPIHDTNFCFSIGAYNDSTMTVINEFEDCYLFE